MFDEATDRLMNATPQTIQVERELAARPTNEVQFLYDRELQWEQNTISSI
jgi:hypothetical protein